MAKPKRTPASTEKAAAPSVIFPNLTPKVDLECRVLLEDQVLLIDNLLSVEECKKFVKLIDNLPLELTPPKKRGEAERVNHRISTPSPAFASSLYTILSPHLPEFPFPASLKKRPAGITHRAAHSLNSNIRLYKYTPTQHFGPHYDDSVSDVTNGVRVTSEWTLLVYLTGVEDGVKGGETLFYLDQGRGKEKEVVSAPLTRGTALLHRHGYECLLHEGSLVEAGNKYILRSDIMFAN